MDLRPAMSLEFTLTESTSRFTRDTSPFRQASKSSRKAPLVAQPPAGLALPESGLEPPVVLGELALLVLVLLLLLVLLALRSGAGEEAAPGSASPAPSCSPPAGGEMFETPALGGDPGGVREFEAMRGGEDKFWCCWDARRDVAIFHHNPSASNKNKQLRRELPGSIRANFRFQIALGVV